MRNVLLRFREKLAEFVRKEELLHIRLHDDDLRRMMVQRLLGLGLHDGRIQLHYVHIHRQDAHHDVWERERLGRLLLQQYERQELNCGPLPNNSCV